MGSGKLEKTRFSVILLKQEAWRAQMHRLDQAWKVYCYSCIPTNFLVDHLQLGGRRRGYSLNFLVSSSITRLGVIFVFASLFPTLFLLIAAMFVINYGLDCFSNLGIAYIYHSAHQLFEYKLVLVFLVLVLLIFLSNQGWTIQSSPNLTTLFFNRIS